MAKEYINHYQTARMRAGMTQEQAAERLDVSVESLRAYETGRRDPPDSIINLMAVLYQSPDVAIRHLRQHGAIAQMLIPDFVLGRPVSEAAARFLRLLADFRKHDRAYALMLIVEDGRVDEEETLFDTILEELRVLMQAMLELKYADRGRDIDASRSTR